MPPSKVCPQWHELMAQRVLHFSAFVIRRDFTIDALFVMVSFAFHESHQTYYTDPELVLSMAQVNATCNTSM